jgi:hypothetical protein
MKQRILTVLVAFDVFIFALLTLGGSKRNETISAAAWSLEMDGKWQGKLFRPLIDWLMSPLESRHCLTAWLIENKAQLWNNTHE